MNFNIDINNNTGCPYPPKHFIGEKTTNLGKVQGQSDQFNQQLLIGEGKKSQFNYPSYINSNNLTLEHTQDKVKHLISNNKKLFFLKHPYDVIEKEAISFKIKIVKNNKEEIKKKEVRFYPTKEVREIFIRAHKENLNLHKELVKSLNNKELTVQKDTTVYFPKSFIPKLQISIRNNNLLRDGEELALQTQYMFVLSQDGQLIVKQKENPQARNASNIKSGRVHHSSLVSGEPVITAGMIELSKISDYSQQLIITNRSGHYKPDAASIDCVLEWLYNQGLNFSIAQDNAVEKNREVVIYFSPITNL